MQESVFEDEATRRGIKRKAEESNLASQAPKRIKVADPSKPRAEPLLMGLSRLLIKMLLTKLLPAKL